MTFSSGNKRGRSSLRSELRPLFSRQPYFRAEVSRVTRPVMELKGFQRITLAAGAKRTVTFEVGPEQMSYHGVDMKRVVEPGRFRVMVGGSSAQVKSVTLDV